jgi:hypothetical protein
MRMGEERLRKKMLDTKMKGKNQEEEREPDG